MIDYQYDDGGREAARYRGRTGDCVVRAIAICARQDYRTVYLTMAEHMKRNGYAATGNACAIRERNRRAPRRKGQLTARRVQDCVLELYGFQKVRLPAGARPDLHRGAPPLRGLHRRHDEARGGRRGRGAPRHHSTAAPISGPSPGRSPRGTSSARRRQAEFETRERKAQSVWVPDLQSGKRQTSDRERSDDMRLAAQAKGGFYPTPPRVIDLIAGLVSAPVSYRGRGQEALRILDPCCGAGDAAARLAERLGKRNGPPIETFGVELHRERAQEASERLDRALAADLFQTSVANGAFGLLFLESAL